MVKLYPNKIPRKLFVSVVDYEQEIAVVICHVKAFLQTSQKIG